MGVRKAFGFEEAKKKAGSAKGSPASDAKIFRRLKFIGEKLCEHARNITPSRESGGYDDQTGNLRSSIGYAIFKNGEKMSEGGFKNIKGGKGIDESKSAIDSYGYGVATMNGWTLVVVAGMYYARYVEAKGYNVLRLTKAEMMRKIDELKSKL